jgi:ABC-2 type transport system permease protein
MTILLPLLMAAAFVLPSLIMARGLGTKRIVVVDGTGKLQSAFEKKENAPAPSATEALSRRRADLPTSFDISYINAPDVDAAAKPYVDRISAGDKRNPLDGLLVIPPDVLQSDNASMKYYSRSSTDFITQSQLTDRANRAIRRQRLEALGIAQAEIDRVLLNPNVDSVQVSKGGQRKSGGTANFFIGFIFAFLLMMPSFVYGVEIMRGIIQEKTDRVVEVLLSSVTPRQLLSGKILGLAMVGLTQIGAWVLMMVAVGIYGAVTAAGAGIDVKQYFHVSTFVYFILFFILAYLTNVCVYAIGGAVCNSDREAQQMLAPVIMVMMLPVFLMGPLITNPDTKLFVVLSMAPVFGPLTMFVRTLVSDPPMIQIIASMVVSALTVTFFLLATAKIFRVGILSYGKRPTIPEILKWMKYA